ncbi:GNAT family N-acetyltransferase [Actinobacillus pleuropneumoniae]|uniref:GNAT family N-acetyltransferase n=1 Tax=Actinobacillus pleuropneumoniae TaxID=715 RepID=UPI0022797231|nr:GNAT family N-acetyltransferase [Actinobacillus pleuropneumoniae]MCY6397411.1 GNAT family N-acetyltransferase [Actinobacillus pleuropneumoniae]
MRKLVILAEMPPLDGGIVIHSGNISQAKQYLGQEHPYAIYDMRAEGGVWLNLDALAIIAGTIQAQGTLYLICPNWDTLEQQLDFDSQRWNGGKVIATPNFYRYFKALVQKFGFQFQTLEETDFSLPKQPPQCQATESLTPQQQKIFEKLPLDSSAIHLITAPRGRGKSTLAGKLAQQLAKTESVLITARSHSVLPNFWKSAAQNIPFFAPDHLLQKIAANQIAANSWLFIDEAASLPLPMLHQLCEYFDKVVLTTTTHNYEGTGRGFSLKFPQQLTKPYQEWQLSKPLRWYENDPLEQFIDELLIMSPPTGANRYAEFYHLLAEAHYKTTPSDLRRLFDAQDQLLHSFSEHQRLVGGIWAVPEGGLEPELAEAIWRGERRPQGNLVAQYLCFQGNLLEACQLRSVRISRIAVQPELQKQGIGKRLISDFILQKIQQNRPFVDYISVSFGLTEHLLHFWQQCGFQLVQITPTKEASSGYHSAIMLYPISAEGQQFVQQATAQFERDLALQPYYAELQNMLPIRPLVQLQMDEQDWRNIEGFALAQCSLAASYVSLTRLYRQDPRNHGVLANLWQQFERIQGKKEWLENLRSLLANYLQYTR